MSPDFSEFDREIDRRGTGSLKWERYSGRDVIPLWVADMDFASPPEVIDALRKRIDHGIFGYSVPHEGLKQAVLAYLKREHGVDAEASWLVFLPGMVPALAYAAASVCQSHESLMVHTPIYPPFLKVHGDTHRELIKVPLQKSTGPRLVYDVDFEAMEQQVQPNTRLLLLCNPHNPVGRVYPRETVERLAEFCVRHDMVLCSDEIHCDLVLEPETAPHFTALRLPRPIQDRCITLMAASKTYNIAGLACAFAIIPNPTLRRKFQQAKNCFVAEVSPLGMHGTEAAYAHGEAWRRRLGTYLRRNRDTLVNFLQERLPMIRIPHIEATYLALLDVSALGLATPQAYFESQGLGFSNGADFDAPQCVRLNFGCTQAQLLKALERLEKAVRAIPS